MKERKQEINKRTIPDKEFIEKNITIINKSKQRQLLKLNSIQLKIEGKIEELRSQGQPPRIVILKARQEGVTTYSQGKMMSVSCQKRDTNCLIVSHEEKSTAAIFAKTKFMYENLPTAIKPLNRASNSKQLILDKPLHYKGKLSGLNSKIVVTIAGKEAIGRSDTYSFVHLSEFAFWKGKDEDSPTNQLSAIMQALPNILDSLAIIESTAKGFNDFKDVWDKAVSGQNGWTPIFFAWHDDPTYRLDFESKEAKKLFKESLTEYEADIMEQFDLDLEQINWYRYTKKIDCNDDVNKMKQENPSSPDEAFIFSGTPIFDNDIVMKRINELERNPLKVLYGKFKYYESYKKLTITKFVIDKREDKIISVRIYEKVKRGHPYTIGADTKGEGDDFYTATVTDVITKRRVATMKADLTSSDLFTYQLYCLGMYYNMALIGLEVNWNTGPIEKLQWLRYPRQYQREKKDDFTMKLHPKYGWRTDGITRPLMIDNHVTFHRDFIECINDLETLREMLTFVRNSNGKPDAQAGKHDDLLFSDMISSEIQVQQPARIDKDSNPELKGIDFVNIENVNNEESDRIKSLWTKYEGVE